MAYYAQPYFASSPFAEATSHRTSPFEIFADTSYDHLNRHVAPYHDAHGNEHAITSLDEEERLVRAQLASIRRRRQAEVDVIARAEAKTAAEARARARAQDAAEAQARARAQQAALERQAIAQYQAQTRQHQREVAYARAVAEQRQYEVALQRAVAAEQHRRQLAEAERERELKHVKAIEAAADERERICLAQAIRERQIEERREIEQAAAEARREEAAIAHAQLHYGQDKCRASAEKHQSEIEALESLFGSIFGLHERGQTTRNQEPSTSTASSDPATSSRNAEPRHDVERPARPKPSEQTKTASRVSTPTETVDKALPSALEKLASIEHELSLATESFTFPIMLSFSTKTPITSTSPNLLFNRTNAPYHAQINKLLQLILAADGVSSQGDKVVRQKRKEVVRRVEAEIAKLEGKRDEMWADVRAKRERGEMGDDQADERSWSGSESGRSSEGRDSRAASVVDEEEELAMEI